MFAANLKNSPVFTDINYEIWFNALQDLTDDEFIRAVNNVIKAEEWFPTIAQIHKYARPTLNIEVRAELAWVEAVKHADAYNTVIFSDKVIHGVIAALGGWITFCHSEFNDWDRKHFKELYLIHDKRGGEGHSRYPVKLIGLFEQVNSAEGYPAHIPKPKMIICDYIDEKPRLEYTAAGEIEQKLLKMVKNKI